jgi:phosphoribosyl 1,2-cyclic phosphate phosphodiesterase
MKLEITILGCSSSTGVPRVALGWGACDPGNPKNRRRRCSLLVKRTAAVDKHTTILVDTSPDLREQLLDAEVNWLDAVLFTHGHADHTHGIDDLRTVAIYKHRRIAAYLDEPTSRSVRSRFGYCFETPPGSSYPPILNEHRLEPNHVVTIDGEGGPIRATCFLQTHGDSPSLGFRFGGLAYSCDLNGVAPESLPLLAGLDVWILDALRYLPHPSHFCLQDALEWIDRVRPRRAILTNLHSDMDYEALRDKLPEHVEPAYDGMRIIADGRSTWLAANPASGETPEGMEGQKT